MKNFEILTWSSFTGTNANVVTIVFLVNGTPMELSATPAGRVLVDGANRPGWRATVSRYFRDGRGWVEVLRNCAVTGIPLEGVSARDPQWEAVARMLAEVVIRISDGD